MAVPGQRKPGQTGGRYGHNKNTSLSRQRGGSPGAPRKSGGGGKKGGGICLIWVLGFVATTGAAGYGIVELLA